MGILRASGRNFGPNVPPTAAVAFRILYASRKTRLSSRLPPRGQAACRGSVPLLSICGNYSRGGQVGNGPVIQPTLLHNHHAHFFLVGPNSACGSIVECFSCLDPPCQVSVLCDIGCPASTKNGRAASNKSILWPSRVGRTSQGVPGETVSPLTRKTPCPSIQLHLCTTRLALLTRVIHLSATLPPPG